MAERKPAAIDGYGEAQLSNGVASLRKALESCCAKAARPISEMISRPNVWWLY
jgi:hypothetical protein